MSENLSESHPGPFTAAEIESQVQNLQAEADLQEEMRNDFLFPL